MDWNEESVSGTIIGEVTFPYEFWIYEKLHPNLPEHSSYYISRRIDHMGFSSDEEALAWFREKYPVEYNSGKVEMRCFDCISE